MKVALIGLEQPFGASLKELLREHGVEARLGSELLLTGGRWAKFRRLAAMDMLHFLYADASYRYLLPAALLRKPIVCHWSGSDVIRVLGERGFRGRRHRRLLRKRVARFLLDSPTLGAELEPWLGFRPQTVRLLPLSVAAEPVALPPQFTVLSYWPSDRYEFYGGPILLKLARRFAGLEFVIVADQVPNRDEWPSNVRFRGISGSLADLWPQVSCLVRIPKHDSLGAMVLEALARGRHVIYSQEFPHCRRASTFEEAAAAIEELAGGAGVNSAGAEYVRENYNPRVEAAKLAAVYREVTGSR